MTPTHLQRCRSRVASLESTLLEIEHAETWIEPQTAPEAGLLSRLLRNHKEQTIRALREARELEAHTAETERLDRVLGELQADIADELAAEVSCADCGEVVKDDERQFSLECAHCDGLLHEECGVFDTEIRARFCESCFNQRPK